MEYENTSRIHCISEKRNRLNPCSNGIRKYKLSPFTLKLVKCLNPCSNGIRKYLSFVFAAPAAAQCLNPCSNGIRKYSLQINKLKNYCFKNITNILK